MIDEHRFYRTFTTKVHGRANCDIDKITVSLHRHLSTTIDVICDRPPYGPGIMHRDGRGAFPTRPLRVEQPPAVEYDTNGNACYEVDSLLAERGSARRRELLVRWKGYGPEADQRKSRTELIREVPHLVAEFDALQAGGRAHINQLAQRQRAG